MNWQVSDYLGLYAAILSTILALWNVFKWINSGPKISGEAILKSKLDNFYQHQNHLITDAEIEIAIRNSGAEPVTLSDFKILTQGHQITLPFTNDGNAFRSIRVSPNDTTHLHLLSGENIVKNEIISGSFISFTQPNGRRHSIILQFKRNNA